MTRRLVFAASACAFGASIAVAALAQSGHGVPTPERVYGDGVTWPLKVRVWKYDMAKLLAPPALSENERTGRILWVQKCAYCHDGVGQPTYRTMGPWLGAAVIKAIGEDNAKAFIRNGDVRMPGFRYGLTDAQIDQVVAFIMTVPESERPTAAQLAGRGEAGAASD